MSSVDTQIQSHSCDSSGNGGKRGSSTCNSSGGDCCCNFVVKACCLNNDNLKSMSHTLPNTSNKQVTEKFKKAKTSSLQLNMNNLLNDHNVFLLLLLQLLLLANEHKFDGNTI